MVYFNGISALPNFFRALDILVDTESRWAVVFTEGLKEPFYAQRYKQVTRNFEALGFKVIPFELS